MRNWHLSQNDKRWSTRWIGLRSVASHVANSSETVNCFEKLEKVDCHMDSIKQVMNINTDFGSDNIENDELIRNTKRIKLNNAMETANGENGKKIGKGRWRK